MLNIAYREYLHLRYRHNHLAHIRRDSADAIRHSRYRQYQIRSLHEQPSDVTLASLKQI